MQLWTQQEGGGATASSLLLLSTPEPGLYEVDQIPVGSYHRLSIYAENLAPLSLADVEVRKGRPEVIECLLSRGGTIQGVVIDEKGKPIMGLPVVVNSILCRRDVKTDPNGHFIASHLPDTRYSVSVEPDSESPYATTVLTGGASCDAEGLRIVVKQKTEVKAPAFGVGASIWQLGRASLPLEQSQCEGKAILLCLFDRNQRPSRNCLRQLVAQAKDLDGEGVVVAAVQATSMDRGELDRWAKENDVTVPLGVLQSSQNGEQAVALDSLPWLILTDRMHIIRAEGFGIDELATRVKEIRDGEP